MVVGFQIPLMERCTSILLGQSWPWLYELDLQLPMQSVPITTYIVSLNPAKRGVLDTPLCD